MSEELKHCKTCGATMRVKGFDYCDRACFMTDPSKIKPNRTFTKEDVEKARLAIIDLAVICDSYATELVKAALNAVGRVEE